MSEGSTIGRVTIGWLYPTSLSTYGDRGNVLALVQRARWRGLETRVVHIEAGSVVPGEVDVFFIGGGQDRAQSQVVQALVGRHGNVLRERLEAGAALLAICGGFQLLGHEYVPVDGPAVPGLGIFDIVTRASADRLVGNVRLTTTRWGEVVGFENHSGRTSLAAGVEPMGTVEVGHGNNGCDATEGAVSGRAVGTYLHGALLPRNPVLADWLLVGGLSRRLPDVRLADLPSAFEIATHGPFRHLRQPRPLPSGRPVSRLERGPSRRWERNALPGPSATLCCAAMPAAG